MTETPKCLGLLPHLSTGVKIPEVLIEGITSGFKESMSAGGLMLAFGRETAPRYVIDSPPGVYDITMGHTGVSIEHFINIAVEAVKRKCVIAEIEADHILIRASPPSEAAKRIYVRHGRRWDEKFLRESISLAQDMIDEAVKTSSIHAFTIDTADLIFQEVDTWSFNKVKDEFEKNIPLEESKRICERYLGKEIGVIDSRGFKYTYKITYLELMRNALKFSKSIEIFKDVYSYIENRMGGKKFTIELALDETINKMNCIELYYILKELQDAGCRVDFVAPNIGFKKRLDFTGSLDRLESDLSRLNAIANFFGTILSIHSGSGSDPYGVKGQRVHEILLKATGGNLKYKISGVYLELLMNLLASFPKSSYERRLYEEMFDSLFNFLKDQVSCYGSLYSKFLKNMLNKYEENIKKGRMKPYDPKAMFFRFYSFLLLNFKDRSGRRPFREEILKLYEERRAFRELVDREVKKVTITFIENLGFSNNVANSKNDV